MTDRSRQVIVFRLVFVFRFVAFTGKYPFSALIFITVANNGMTEFEHPCSNFGHYFVCDNIGTVESSGETVSECSVRITEHSPPGNIPR